MKEFLERAKISPLHSHTVLSILDGAATIDQYISWCKENGAPGLGVTDHGYAIGGLELYTKCKKAGIVPLPGVEFYLAPDADFQFAGKPYDYYHITAWATTEQGYRNLMKLASKSWEDDKLEGGKRAKDGGPAPRVVKLWGGTQEKPRITFDELLTHHEGIVLGTGCLIGVAAKCFLNGEFRGAERNLLRLLEVFKGRMFAEVMPHSCQMNYDRQAKGFVQNPPLSFDECKDFDPTGKRQMACNNQVIRLARKYGLPLLLTIDSHFVKPEQKRLQDVLLSSSDGGWTFYDNYSMLTTQQAAELWASHHGWDVEQKKIFQEAVENNDTLVNMAKGLTITDSFRQPAPDFPADLIDKDPKEARKAMLMRAVIQHGRMRWDSPAWVERLTKELDVICDNEEMDFADYFIFLEKCYRWAAENSLLAGAGRGSGAGSLLCYLLKITHLDPIAWNLPFERFLSPARIKRKKWPDIDADFGNRDILVAHLREEYGDKMAQCSTLGTLKLKSAIKDACRAIWKWNLMAEKERADKIAEVEAVCKTIPNEPQGVSSKDFLLGYTDSDGNVHEGHLFQNPALDTFLEKNPAVQDAVMQLFGIPRSIGRHASAFLISNAPISDSVPTCMISGYLCTQYQATASNNMVEKAGLIKFDFLRINTLDDISGCIRLVQKKLGYKVWEEEVVIDGDKFRITRGDLPIDRLPTASGELLDVYELPEDPAVFKDLSEGKTETVFQMNTPLMTGFTKRIRPTTKRHLSDIVALVRPGPLLADTGQKDGAGNPLTMTEAYIAAKQGTIQPAYAHSGMRPILEETYGCAAYQEQLQQMFVDLAGYSLEEADYLRETLAKKKRQEMEKAVPELRRRLKERGWTDAQQDVFVSLCISSSKYSFNRSHSAAYATAAYQCAYLKHHHPIEWWTSVLQNAKVEDIRDKGYAQTLQKEGILELPTVNGPTDTFRPENGRVLAPLYLIDRVGDTACHEIEQVRRQGGSFTSFQDFFERVDGRKVNERVVHNLILCDCFASIEPGKAPQKLLEEYHYLRKVSDLKIGEGKRGQDLRDAVTLYQEKERQKSKHLAVPALFNDQLQMEIARAKAMPIYRVNVHELFREALKQGAGIQYDPRGCTIRHGMDPVPVFESVGQILTQARSGMTGAWAGLIQSQDTFQYTDKKSRQKVTALKLQVANDGETVEVVVWPDLYQALGDPPEDKLVVAIGKLRESREPGRWEISVADIHYV